MSIFESAIMALLSIDTLRALIAMLGYVKPDSKYAWLFYGRYERNLIKTALKDLGFSEEKTNKIFQSMSKISKNIEDDTGVKGEDAAVHLIILLSKYIEKFKQPIQYGAEKLTKSNYYLNTMEISHNVEDRRIMAAAMVHLVNQNVNKKPEIIFAPKAGNPLFVEEISNILNTHLVVAKAPEDNSRISTVKVGTDTEELFRVNYEGSRAIKDSIDRYQYLIMDCNTSTGTQLLNIIHDIRQVTKSEASKINVFVLFRADNKENIDKKFENHNSQLFRFFDFDEDIKKMLYAMNRRCHRKNRCPSFYCDEDVKEAKNILDQLRNKGSLFFDADDIYVGMS